MPVKSQDQNRTPVRSPQEAAIHAVTPLGFEGSTLTREELWERLDPKARAKAEESEGNLLQWWAAEVDGRVKAVRLSTQALVILTPTLNQQGKPATRVHPIQLDRSSFRSRREATVVEPVTPSAGQRTDTVETPLSRQLDAGIKALLGQLPARAQTLIQDPFLRAGNELKYDYHYYRTGNPRSFSSGTLYTWCYLVDEKTVTFCAGTGLGFREPEGAESWQVTCWQAQRSQKTGIVAR